MELKWATPFFFVFFLYTATLIWEMIYYDQHVSRCHCDMPIKVQVQQPSIYYYYLLVLLHF